MPFFGLAVFLMIRIDAPIHSSWRLSRSISGRRAWLGARGGWKLFYFLRAFFHSRGELREEGGAAHVDFRQLDLYIAVAAFYCGVHSAFGKIVLVKRLILRFFLAVCI